MKATLRTSRIPFDERDREDLEGEGLLILCELAAGYESHREGYESPGTFAGYAARYLPRRLTTAWHRLGEHRQRVEGDGTRSWVMPSHSPIESPTGADWANTPDEWDSSRGDGDPALRFTDDDSRMLGAYAGGSMTPVASLANPVLAQIGVALSREVKTEHQFTIKVALLRSMEKSRPEIAQALGADDVEVRMALLRLKRIGDGLKDEGSGAG